MSVTTTLSSQDGQSVLIDESVADTVGEMLTDAVTTTTEADEPVADAEPFSQVDAEDDDDLDFRARIWNAEQECRRRELQVEVCKSDLKIAKEEYDASVEKLRKIANEGSQPTLFDQAKASPVAEQLEPAAVEPSDDSWRDRNFCPFVVNLEIKGFGAKKQDALIDAVESFGQFEDLRIEAQQKGVHLCKLLPSGLGEEITDAIIEAFLVAKGQPDGGDCIPVINDKMPAATKLALVNRWDAYRAKIEAENDMAEIELDDCYVSDNDRVQLTEGFEAFENNLAVHTCDADTPDGQADWVYGWCLAKRKEQLLASAESKADAAEEDQESDEDLADL